MEVVLDQLGIRPAAFEIATHGPHELRAVVGASSPHGVGLDVLVDHLVGVQLRTVSGHEEQPHLSGALFHPLAHSLAAMNRVTIHNEEDLAFSLFGQSPQEAQEDRRREAFLAVLMTDDEAKPKRVRLHGPEASVS